MALSAKNQIKATLESFEERYAILRTQDSQKIKWPIKNLPDSAKIGETITLKLTTAIDQTDLDYEHKRQLLEELIN